MKEPNYPLMGIIIIIVAILVTFSAIFAYQHFLSSQSPNVKVLINSNYQNSNIRTADWQTYTNTDYGFEIQYPQGTNVSDSVSINRGKKITFKINSSRFLIIEVLSQDPQCPDTTAVGDLPSKMIGNTEFMGVAGHQLGYEIKDNDYPPYVAANEYCAVVKNLEYKIIPAILYQQAGPESFPETDSVLNHMISTFKFTQ